MVEVPFLLTIIIRQGKACLIASMASRGGAEQVEQARLQNYPREATNTLRHHHHLKVVSVESLLLPVHENDQRPFQTFRAPREDAIDTTIK